MLLNPKKRYLTFILALFITGCGGSSQSSPNSTQGSVGGVWIGKYLSSVSDFQSNVIGIVSQRGEVFWIYKSDGIITQISEGRISLNGRTIQGLGLGVSGALISEIATGGSYSNGLTRINTEVEGTVDEGRQLTLRETYQNTETGVYTLFYDTFYDNNSSLSLLEGEYSTTEVNGVTTVHNISNTGHLTGGNSLDCTYDGQISIIDDFYNLYRVSTTVTNCRELNGSWRGYLTLTGSNNNLNNKITWFTRNANTVRAYTLNRQ